MVQKISSQINNENMKFIWIINCLHGHDFISEWIETNIVCKHWNMDMYKCKQNTHTKSHSTEIKHIYQLYRLSGQFSMAQRINICKEIAYWLSLTFAHFHHIVEFSTLACILFGSVFLYCLVCASLMFVLFNITTHK